MSSFIDHAQIEVHSGKGGAGCVSFRREKYVPRGGPDGGDGGRGGDVIIKASNQHRTLLDYTYKKIFKAGKGRPGSGNNRHGKDGRNTVIPVPPGTMIINAETEEVIADLVAPGESIVVARGGRGGKGNAHFKSATHQVPRFSQPGEPGESFLLNLELKLIADVGLVGFPNAGKSTFISVVSNARPKIASYPFTTLSPNLGLVRHGDRRSFVIADIPGIIEGSHDGKGLGDQFLRHIERTAVILLMVDVSDMADPSPETAVQKLILELKQYQTDLVPRISAVVATKTDAVSPENMDRIELLKKEAETRNLLFFRISSVSRMHLDAVLNYLSYRVFEQSETETEAI